MRGCDTGTSQLSRGEILRAKLLDDARRFHALLARLVGPALRSLCDHTRNHRAMLSEDLSFGGMLFFTKCFHAHLINDCFTVGFVSVVDNPEVVHAASVLRSLEA